jgi:hypothetical protein
MPKRKTIPFLRSDRLGNWFWRPSQRLRGHFHDVSLGKDRIAAEGEAIDLNRQLEEWLRKGGEAKLSEGALPRRQRLISLASIGEMISHYRESEAHQSLRETTRTAARPIIARIEQRWADEQLQMVSRPAVRAWLEDIRATAPGSARQIGLRFRAIWNWALSEELTIRPNPLLRIKTSSGRAIIGAGGKRKVRMGWEDVRALVAAADRLAVEAANPVRRNLGAAKRAQGAHHFTTIGHVLVLATLCIMRESDALAARRSWFHWHGDMATGHWRLRYRQSKSKVEGVASSSAKRDRPTSPASSSAKRDRPDITASSSTASSTPKAGRPTETRGELTGGRLIDMALPAPVVERLTPWLLQTAGDPDAALCSFGISFAADRFAEVRVRAREARPAIDAAVAMRDCRRSGFILYKLDGADIEWICSISGHTIEEGFAIVEHYLPKTPEQADQAVRLLKVAL